MVDAQRVISDLNMALTIIPSTLWAVDLLSTVVKLFPNPALSVKFKYKQTTLLGAKRGLKDSCKGIMIHETRTCPPPNILCSVLTIPPHKNIAEAKGKINDKYESFPEIAVLQKRIENIRTILALFNPHLSFREVQNKA